MKAARPLVLATHEYLPFRGGAAVYVREVAAAACKLGYKLEVWTADRRQLGTDTPSHTESSADPPVVRFRSSGRLTPGSLGALAWGWWRQRQRLRAGPVVLMSVGAQMVFFWFDLFGIVSAKRTLVVFYGSEVLRFARGRFWRRLARRYYARAGGFAACSRYTAELAQESGLLPVGTAVLAAVCAIPEAFVRRPTPADAAPPEDGRWRVLTVARLHPRKGQTEVARALASLPEELRGRIIYQLVGVGDESYRAEIAGICRAGGVRCEFLGGLDEEALAAVYARSTLYIQASRTLARSVEGFGISFLEAGFYGKPSVAFRSGGVAEAVLDGRSGLLVPEDDVAALARAVGRLLENQALREQMGAAAREHVASLRWEDAARALCQTAGRMGGGPATPQPR